MKSLLIVALLAVAAQAIPEDLTNVQHVQRTMPEVEGAPEYNKGGRIINGMLANRGQFPYQAALFLDGNSFCGGSLISPRWVLTAGHCAYRITSITVHLGAQVLNNVNNEPGRVVITTTQKIVNSFYNPDTLYNDIALVNLGQDVALTPYIGVVGLVSGSNTFVGAPSRVSGWGKTSDASSSVSTNLNFVDVVVMSNTACQETYEVIFPSTLCTRGVNSKGVCNGDSGGALIELNSGKQIGVVSFVSSRGCESGSPNGYTRVTSFASWISLHTDIVIA